MSPQVFPHMLPAESVLWGTWLLDHAAEYDRFDYDVRVGPGRPVDPRLPAPVVADWILQSMRRIDVVGYRAGAPTLFEVNPRGSRAAYGALKLYAAWYRNGPRWIDGVFDRTAYIGPLPLVAVVGQIAPDMRQVMEEDGIRVIVVAPAASE